MRHKQCGRWAWASAWAVSGESSNVADVVLKILTLKFLPIAEATMGNGYSTVYGGMQNFDIHLPSFASGIVGLIVLGAIVGAAVYCFRRRR